MSRVGIREAKANLSRLLRDVQRGEVVTITDHGRPVARLLAVVDEPRGVEDLVRELERRGLVEPRTRRPLPLPPPIDVPGEIAQKILQEHRNA
jgi:prevent-host-death family protein